MFLTKVKSEGVAHISFILGDGDRAAVIDPRRDVHVYLEIAAKMGTRITHIFETHRNEDYVIGSRDLAEHSGAEIHHGSALDFVHHGGGQASAVTIGSDQPRPLYGFLRAAECIQQFQVRHG